MSDCSSTSRSRVGFEEPRQSDTLSPFSIQTTRIIFRFANFFVGCICKRDLNDRLLIVEKFSFQFGDIVGLISRLVYIRTIVGLWRFSIGWQSKPPCQLPKPPFCTFLLSAPQTRPKGLLDGVLSETRRTRVTKGVSWDHP